MTFKELNITEPILKAIKEKGYTVPTPIQEKAIPAALAKRDTQLYTLLYQRLCIMIGYTNNNEFTPRLTFAHRTYSLDLAERNTKCATISVYLADIASLKIICINWYCF